MDYLISYEEKEWCFLRYRRLFPSVLFVYRLRFCCTISCDWREVLFVSVIPFPCFLFRYIRSIVAFLAILVVCYTVWLHLRQKRISLVLIIFFLSRKGNLFKHIYFIDTKYIHTWINCGCQCISDFQITVTANFVF